ncbi:MAG: damage-inducible protein DinB [Alphaproteobacteria bacterium]|nr:damage-inducible protein DinB [Alphaproteobacteria bacterium]
MTADYAIRMAAYNRWMNEKIYESCTSLNDVARKEDRRAFFSSIHGTLNHLLFGDLAWFGRFRDGAPRGGVTSPDNQLYEDFDELRRARAALDAEIEEWASTLTPEWLSAPFTFESMVDGKTRTASAWKLVVHMFNHQTHHRGQLTTLLSQAGVDIGTTDLTFMPE